MRGEPHGEARYIHAIDVAFFEMVRQRRVARSIIRVHTYPAGTQHVAIADFQQAAFKFVSHGTPLCTWRTVTIIKSTLGQSRARHQPQQLAWLAKMAQATQN